MRFSTTRCRRLVGEHSLLLSWNLSLFTYSPFPPSADESRFVYLRDQGLPPHGEEGARSEIPEEEGKESRYVEVSLTYLVLLLMKVIVSLQTHQSQCRGVFRFRNAILSSGMIRLVPKTNLAAENCGSSRPSRRQGCGQFAMLKNSWMGLGKASWTR